MPPNTASSRKKQQQQQQSAVADNKTSPLLRLYNTLRYHVVPPLFVVIFTLAVQFLAHKANPAVPFQLNRFVNLPFYTSYRLTALFFRRTYITWRKMVHYYSFFSVLSTHHRLWGSAFSWKVVGIFMSWGFVFLLVPSKVFKGPVTSFGYVPLYSDNGFFYYIASIATVLIFPSEQIKKQSASREIFLACHLLFLQQFIGLHFVYPDLSVDLYTNMPDILGSMNVFAFVLCSLLLIMGKWRPQSKEKIARYASYFLLSIIQFGV